MSYAFNDDKSKLELDVVISDINLNINGKADEEHTHSADDITDGTLAVERGGTGQTSLQATRSAMGLGNTTAALPVANGGTGQTTLKALRNAAGLGNTTGAVPIANGGTGAATAAAARANLAAAQKRNLSANYAGSTANSPDFLLKTFTGSKTWGGGSFPIPYDVDVSVSGYLAIAVAGFSATSPAVPLSHFGAVIKNSTTATLRVESAQAGSGSFSYTLQVLYVRTAMINQ